MGVIDSTNKIMTFSQLELVELDAPPPQPPPPARLEVVELLECFELFEPEEGGGSNDSTNSGRRAFRLA